MKTYGGSGCIDPHFLDLGTSWRWVVSFTLRPLYPGEESPVPTGKEAGWTSEPVDFRTGLDHVKKWKFLNLPGLELRPPCHPARSQFLYRLCYPGFIAVFNVPSIVCWGTVLQAGRSRIRFALSLDFSIDLILPTTLWPWCRLSL
jgi:hypothetical protein